MHNSKALYLLKTFSKEEFREFGAFIESPFHNRENIIVKFYNVLKAEFPLFTGQNLRRINIFKKLYPDKPFDDALMRNTISDLLSLAEEYIKNKQFSRETFYNQYLLLKELTNRKQQSLFKMNFKKAEKALKSSEVRDEIYYQNNFLLEDELRRNVVVNSSRILFHDDNLNAQAKNLHIYHLTENIKLYAIMLNQAKFTFDHKFNFGFLEVVREFIEKNYEGFSDVPYIIIFYNCVMLFKTEEKRYFDALKSEVKKHFRKLSLTDRKNMFIVLTNHSQQQIKKGKFEFYKESFEIHKEFIRTKAYFEGNDFMAHYIYKSAAISAIDAGETEWAEKFINQYRALVHIDFRDSAFYYCSSRLHLSKGEYDEAIESLSKVQAFDFTDRQNVNQTLLMIYYCKNETESFLSLVDSFRHFLKRNKKVRKQDFKMFNNFITCIKKLYTLKNKDRDDIRPDLIIFKNEMAGKTDVISKKWLLQKADELIYSV
ncbi:MAG: hypothetical protein IPL53_02620 [Ignavibacteria bacterium]|nr:hypothetical protein [Ignavibacteria bacterium]